MLQLFYEMATLAAALIAGLLAVRRMNAFFRLIFVQLLVWIFFYALAYGITSWQLANHRPIDNRWAMNLHLLLETGLLLAAARFAIQQCWGTYLAIVAYLFFLVVFCAQGFRAGFGIYLNYADVAACISITVVFSFTLYHFSRQARVKWYAPEKLICLGILAYFACSVPYVSMMHYLQKSSPAINTFLYHLINDFLANVRYLMMATAFWLLYKNKDKSTHYS